MQKAPESADFTLVYCSVGEKIRTNAKQFIKHVQKTYTNRISVVYNKLNQTV